MPPRFPVLWLTILAFVIVAVGTWDGLVGGFLLIAVLPAILFGQWCIRSLFRYFRSPVRLRRAVMLLPALMLAFVLFRHTNGFGGRQTNAVTVALAGHTPKGIRELYVQEDAWTDYVVSAYFKCDPASLRAILEQPPFARSHYQPERFSFAHVPFLQLRALPDAHGVVVFRRSDLEEAQGSCTIYTDSAFSFAYIEYDVD